VVLFLKYLFNITGNHISSFGGYVCDEGKTTLMLAAEGRHDETARGLTQAEVAK